MPRIVEFPSEAIEVVAAVIFAGFYEVQDLAGPQYHELPENDISKVAARNIAREAMAAYGNWTLRPVNTADGPHTVP